MPAKVVRIVHNAVTAKLVEPDREARLIVSEQLSYQVSGVENMRGLRGGWDGHASLFRMRENTFPAGFIRLVRKRLEREGYRVMVTCRPAPEPRGDAIPVVDSFGQDPRYDYQYETMNRLVSLKGMIAQIATGGGKSRIFKLCAQRLMLPTLFITTRKSLMYQMAQGFADTIKNREIGIIGDGHWSPKPNGVNFAIVDTLAARLEVKTEKDMMDKAITAHFEMIEKELNKILRAKSLPTNLHVVRNPPPAMVAEVARLRASVEKRFPIDPMLQQKVKIKLAEHEARRKEAIEFLRGIQFLCLEEAHEASADGFYQVANQCVNAWYRLALTATPFLRDDVEANMKLMAVSGPIGIKVSEKLLIDHGILAKPYFVYKKLDAPKGVARGTPYASAYKKGIVENLIRNSDICSDAYYAAQYGLPVITLVNHTAHGKTLERDMRTLGLRVKFIHGEHEQDERAHYLAKLGNGELDVLIGSTILDVGVDVPGAGFIQIAGGGKAEVAHRQRIGRGLRAKKSGPNIAFIADYTDDFNTHLARHGRERRRIVESTPGFAENIIDRLDFEAYGFTKKAA